MNFEFFYESQYKSPFVKFCSSFYNNCQDIFIPVHKVLLLFHDLAIIFIGLFSAVVFYNQFFSDVVNLSLLQLYFVFFIIVLLHVFFGRWNQIFNYQVILNKSRHFNALVVELFLSIASIYVLSYIFRSYILMTNTKFILLSYVFILIYSVSSRIFVLPNLFLWLVNTDIIHRKLLIVGINSKSIAKAKFLSTCKNSYFKVCGFVSEGSYNKEAYKDKIRVLGQVEDIEQLCKAHQITDILICYEKHDVEQLHQLISECKKTKKTIHLQSPLFGVIDKKMEIEEIGNISSFRFYPKADVDVNAYLKRALDLLGALALIIFLLPLWLFIALIIKFDSPGPVFYKPPVIGKDGQPFTMFKFRSMTYNCSVQAHESKVRKMILENGDTKKLRNDSRITKVGKVLRKLSFDEFPQLINVVRGEMSLVGPRPCLPYEYEVMKEWQKQRVNVKPGMTGLWQIKGRDEVLFNDQIILDLYYVEHQSLLFDIEILLGTVPVVLFGRGGN